MKLSGMTGVLSKDLGANLKKPKVELFELQKKNVRDFPGGPVGKTPHSQCRGPGFGPSSGN